MAATRINKEHRGHFDVASGLSSVISVAKQYFEKIPFDLERGETKSLYILLNVVKAFFCVNS